MTTNFQFFDPTTAKQYGWTLAYTPATGVAIAPSPESGYTVDEARHAFKRRVENSCSIALKGLDLLMQNEPLIVAPTIQVSGCFGRLTVDFNTGAVLNYKHYDDSDPGYAKIIRINVDEMKSALGSRFEPGTNWDIVDVGTWDDQDVYDCPLDARSERLTHGNYSHSWMRKAMRSTLPQLNEHLVTVVIRVDANDYETTLQKIQATFTTAAVSPSDWTYAEGGGPRRMTRSSPDLNTIWNESAS